MNTHTVDPKTIERAYRIASEYVDFVVTSDHDSDVLEELVNELTKICYRARTDEGAGVVTHECPEEALAGSIGFDGAAR